MTYVIAAAGTGGHVYPALSVAEALVERGVRRADILFLGGQRFEAQAVPEAGFRFAGFDLTHLRRSLSPENLKIPVVLRRTSAAMAREVRDRAGRVVLGMSGYVTVPAAMAARRASVPFVLQEQNSVPGLAARFAARRAERVFLGLPGPAEALPRSEIVGNPMRPALADFDRGALRHRAKAHFGIEGLAPVLGIMGGSQGAKVLNESVAGIVAAAAPGAVVHITGWDAFEAISRSAAGAPLPWRCVPYEQEMELFYAAVDLVICRAGAMTVTELAATATPSILVPLARVGQQGNAEVLGSRGGAMVVEEGDVGSLAGRVGRLLGDEHGRAAMARAAHEVHRGDAASRIAKHLMELADA